MLKNIFLFAVIFTLAVFLRLYGLNWDQNHHLHPDERFLTMVTNAISWPNSLQEYLNTNNSPLNPHNNNFGFFVYGTFPIFLVKFLASKLTMDAYDKLTLLGRAVSAIFDLGTVILVYLIAKKASSKNISSIHHSSFIIHNFPLLAMFFYTISVLPIQLSHFFAVDTFLTFFITLSFYLLVKLISSSGKILNIRYLPCRQAGLILNTCLGISFGLALASKISAVLFTPILAFGFLFFLIKQKKLFLIIGISVLFIITCYFTFRLTQPYLFLNPNLLDFSLNPKTLDNWTQLRSFDNPNSGIPPGIQWIKTKPYLFPLKNLVLWGLGLPQATIAVLAIVYLIYWLWHKLKRKGKERSGIDQQIIILILSLSFIIFLFGYQGIQFSKPMRYLFPIYPFLALTSAFFLMDLIKKLNNDQAKFIISIIIAVSLVYPLAFTSIYSQTNTRIAASEWIYQNIPQGSTIACEHWDDCLPLSVTLPNDSRVYLSNIYKNISLPLYDPDTQEKWQQVAQELKNTDYIILSSSRLYGSIMTVPEKYPRTYQYYQSLFNGSLGFKKIAEFSSRPNIALPFVKVCLTPPFARYGIIALPYQECSANGISFVDDCADESFTVYDHAKVIIFKNMKL